MSPELGQQQRNQEQHAPHLVVDDAQLTPARLQVSVIEHSLFYWWPVWLLGFIFGLLTYFQVPNTFVESIFTNPAPDNIAQTNMTTNKMGVAFLIITMVVILVTNVTMRGWTSIIVVVSILFFTVLFAYLGWWDAILNWLGRQQVFMNSGFYFFFATTTFIIWCLAFFIFDRTEYWVFYPGQAVRKMLVGTGERTYDTGGMSVYKMRNDLFRHWILGLGSGDLHIATSGAASGEFVLKNVLFIGGKIDKIQTLVAMKPDELGDIEAGNAPG